MAQDSVAKAVEDDDDDDIVAYMKKRLKANAGKEDMTEEEIALHEAEFGYFPDYEGEDE